MPRRIAFQSVFSDFGLLSLPTYGAQVVLCTMMCAQSAEPSY